MSDFLKIPEPGRWSFQSPSVAAHFDAHVKEQLPWYDLINSLIVHVAQHYLPHNGVMYDVGASTGNVTRLLKPLLQQREVNAISIESSAEMAAQWHGHGQLAIHDARDYSYSPCDFVVCSLLLMFLPPIDQRALLLELVRSLKKGGALLLVDKTEPKGGYLGTVMSRLALAGKVAQGANPDEIIRKELSLAGVQRPIQPRHLFDELSTTEVFRFGDFAAWIIQG